MRNKVLRCVVAILALPIMIWCGFTFADNSGSDTYGIVYDNPPSNIFGDILGQNNVQQDPTLVNSLYSLVKAYNNIEVNTSGSGWQHHYLSWDNPEVQNKRCIPFHYFLITKDTSVGDNLSFVLAEKDDNGNLGKYSIEANIKKITFNGSSNRKYAVGVTGIDGELVAGGNVYSDNECKTSLGYNGLGPWSGDKVFIELNLKLHKRGKSEIFKSNEQYFGITDIDSGQSYKILNSDNLLSKSNMFTRNWEHLQQANNAWGLKNRFVGDSNYIFSENYWDSAAEKTRNVGIDDSNSPSDIFVKLKDDGTAQNSGLNVVFGYAMGAGSGIEYYTKRYTVIYEPGSHGSIKQGALSNEVVFSGDNPIGSSVVADTGYHFTNCWKANKNVRLEGGTSTINAGTCLTPEQVKKVIVNEDITFTANYAIDQIVVNYESDSHGSITGIRSENVDYGSKPSGSTSAANTGYHFTNCWKANKNVRLEGGTSTINAGTCLTPEQVKKVIVTEPITFVAYHDPNGSITVTKINSETEKCDPAFNSDVTFTLKKDNQTKSTKGLTNCQVRWDNIDEYGTYQIVENYSGNSYTPSGETTRTVVINNNNSNNLNVTVTFANTPKKGKITVEKRNSETNECVDDFKTNAKFSLINKTGITIKYGNSNYENGETVVANASLNSDCNIIWDNLPYGNYEITETYNGAIYNIDDTQPKPAAVSANSTTITFTNTPKKGNITINKIDSETGTCESIYGLSLAGTEFKIYNNTGVSIKYKNQIIENGDYVDTATISNVSGNTCHVVFENLPYGDYKIKETATPEGYAPNTTEYTATIPSDANITVSNQPIRGDLMFVKMDANNATPIPNVLFSISALDNEYNVTETHLAVTDQNGVINTASSFIPHSNYTNGYDTLYDETDNIPFAGYGIWFGLSSSKSALPVNDNLGALPYGRYLIEEMRCSANNFCYRIEDQKRIIRINEAGQIVNLGDWDNTCSIFSLETDAVDPKDNNKYIEALKEAKIVDHINYCARTDRKFTINGILMDKATGEPLLIDGKTIEKTIEVAPKDECEKVDMEFVFDGTGLGGRELVVFEKLYYDNELIVSHEDIDDEAQTVEMVYLHTFAADKSTRSKTLPLGENVVVQDAVEYCLKPGFEYTVKGIIMNKKTGEELLVNDNVVNQEITFTPEKPCGKFDMFYELNTADLGGAELVIFESLYRGEELLLEHKDVNDADETINVALPAPNTGAPMAESGTSQAITYVFGITLGALFVVLPSHLHHKKIGFGKKR